MHPPFSLLWNHDRARIAGHPALVGVDEAGRGCLAGPVYAAAVRLEPAFFATPWERLDAPALDDSKKLSPDDRTTAAGFVRALADRLPLRFAVGRAEVDEIERFDILGATVLAMGRALEDLGAPLPAPAFGGAPPDAEQLSLGADADAARPLLLVDGRPIHRLAYRHEGIVGGDGRSLSIAMASVLAKVARDAWMEEADAAFPAYGWRTNRGYGTRGHREAIRTHGPSPLHRKRFLRNLSGG